MERQTSTNSDDIRRQAEFDRQMGFARINRMRGDYSKAAESVRLALQVKPDDAEAIEFAADILAARGELQKASDIYKSLFEKDPACASAEQKFAKLTIQIAEGIRQQALLKEMADNPAKFHKAAGLPNPAVAALLSLVPGFGHIYCRQTTKGIVIFLSTMIAWFLLALTGINWKIILMRGGLQTYLQNMDPMVVAISCLASAIQLYALVDAPRYANQLKEQAAKNGSETE